MFRPLHAGSSPKSYRRTRPLIGRTFQTPRRSALYSILISIVIACLIALVVIPFVVYSSHRSEAARIAESSGAAFHRAPDLSEHCSSLLSRNVPGLYPGQTFHVRNVDEAGALRRQLEALDRVPVVRRYKTYRSMAASLRASPFKLGGEVTQGLRQDNIFTFADPEDPAHIGPRPRALLQALLQPVRAVIAPIRDPAVAQRMTNAVRAALRTLPGPSVTFYDQDPDMLHATVFHTSTYDDPWTPHGEKELKAEGNAIHNSLKSLVRSDYGGDLFAYLTPEHARPKPKDPKQAVLANKKGCAIRAVLERVVVTPAGVLLACWQSVDGSDITTVREALRGTFASTPGLRLVKQVITNKDILHTTLGRFLLPPPGAKGEARALGKLEAQELSDALTESLCGLTVDFTELWLVREDDLLALGLRGKYEAIRKFKMHHCS